MKKIIFKNVVLSLIMMFFSISNLSYANNSMNTKMNNNKNSRLLWVCETNASSASSEADKRNDENMKKAKSVKAAFDFAMQHCRDCTKITCSMENK